MDKAVNYKPSAYYWRKQIRETDDVSGLKELALLLCGELEMTKAWIRERGMIPPKSAVTVDEANEKGWELD